MRFPIRSETDAFHLAIATGVIAGIGVLVGALSTALVGLIAFLALGLLAFSAYLASADRERRQPLREAAAESHHRRGSVQARHVLVVANEPLRGQELRERLAGQDAERVELDVLAPVLSSRTHLAYTDIDEHMRQARERLRRSLSWARTQGFLARGTIGDADLAASIEDQLREFGADEVIVVTSDEAERWQERDELRRLREQLDVPVVQVAAPATATARH